MRASRKLTLVRENKLLIQLKILPKKVKKYLKNEPFRLVFML